MDFGSMFDFLGEPRTESAPAHAPALLCLPEPPHIAPQTPWLAETLSRDSLPLVSAPRQTSAEPAIGASVSIAVKPAEPGVILTPSIADFAGSLLDNMGLAGWSRSVDPTFELNNQSRVASAQLVDEQQQNASGSQLALAAKLLNSPEHRRLGSRNAENSQSTASTNEKSARRLTFDGSAVGLSGIQAALISKYSDSLSSSRALLSSTTRINRPRTTHDWHSKTGGPDGHLVGERSAALIQYEPVEPANTGVNKVVRGHLAKEIIQREVDSKPAVRRMRRVKSEAKLVPLKAIRLRLDGSIVGSQASMAHQTRDSSKQGMSYVVKDGLIRGVGGSHMDQRLGASQAAIARSGPSKSANASVYGEFNEIRARLQMAEDCKRQQQRANLSDRERADDMRIADIIENRQDIPLAAQLEERRNVQLAKQQALLQQQLEQQRQQLEQQRAFIEQQQQHQLFKRQSLHPSINSSSQVFAGAPAYDGQQQRGMYVGAMPAPSQYQPPAHHHGAYQHMQPVASIRGPNPHWAQQHSGSS
ncbi:hypothetical protein IWW38_004276, partial [Coemansia aciculifera]